MPRPLKTGAEEWGAGSENECFAVVHTEIPVFRAHCPTAFLPGSPVPVVLVLLGDTLVSAFNILFVSLGVPPEGAG